VWSGGKVTSSTVDSKQVQNSGPHLLRPETTWAYDESKGNCLFLKPKVMVAKGTKHVTGIRKGMKAFELHQSYNFIFACNGAVL